MPNIALLNYCNLSCPYCFANEFIEDNKTFISLEQFNKILTFLEKNPEQITRIGLIGGEPTLHPMFKEILKTTINFCKQYNLPHPVVFSNGICLEKYLKFFINDVSLLLNINEPEIIGEQSWKKILSNIELLNQLGAFEKNNITFGINIYPNIKNYQYIFDLAKKYNQTEIRCSYVAPKNNFINSDKDKYYSNGKKLFLEICDMAINFNIKLRIDCNHIPLCYFTKLEQEKIKSICLIKDNFWCNPVVDITPDFKATCCFGAYNLVDLNYFNNLEEVKRYFSFNEIYPRIKNNNSIKCSNCEKLKMFLCQGGCLSFANK